MEINKRCRRSRRAVIHRVDHPLAADRGTTARTPSVQLRSTGQSKITGRYSVVLQATLSSRLNETSPYNLQHMSTQPVTSRHHAVAVGEWCDAGSVPSEHNACACRCVQDAAVSSADSCALIAGCTSQ